MSVLTRPAQPITTPASEPLLGSAPSSRAGAVETLAGLHEPPAVRLPRVAQTLWFGQRQTSFVFRHQRKFGDVWSAQGYVRGQPVVTSHPDHVRSLFTAPEAKVPTLAEESPLRPVLGPRSVLIANGPRHLRQRKLLLPPFHGEAIARYEQMIADAARREIARWPIGKPFALAPRMQAITLDVIMAGIFGIEGKPKPGTLEHALRTAIKGLTFVSTLPGAKLGELMNLGHDEPFGFTWAALLIPDRLVHAVIRKRRRQTDLGQRTDIMSLIMRARTEDGEALDDDELRDELMTLVLAGHETTANQLAWTWERLTRSPDAYARLTSAVRGADDVAGADMIEATIAESMRSRPVIPITGRRVTVPWQLGEYGVPAGTAVAISILLVHHREDVYPDPFSFRPERWLGAIDPDAPQARRFVKPGTYEWLPFGGGTRRCLGATLALAEQRVVLREMVMALEIEPTDAKPERPVHRNVTMIPAKGGRVVVGARR
jgi:cytochrome P450